MADYVIETHGLTRYFGSKQVVAPLDVAIHGYRCVAVAAQRGTVGIEVEVLPFSLQ